jgi:hypothetical protein
MAIFACRWQPLIVKTSPLAALCPRRGGMHLEHGVRARSSPWLRSLGEYRRHFHQAFRHRSGQRQAKPPAPPRLQVAELVWWRRRFRLRSRRPHKFFNRLVECILAGVQSKDKREL